MLFRSRTEGVTGLATSIRRSGSGDVFVRFGSKADITGLLNLSPLYPQNRTMRPVPFADAKSPTRGGRAGPARCAGGANPPNDVIGHPYSDFFPSAFVFYRDIL